MFKMDLSSGQCFSLWIKICYTVYIMYQSQINWNDCFCLVNKENGSLNVPDRRGRRLQLCPAGTQRGSTRWWEHDELWVTQTTNVLTTIVIITAIIIITGSRNINSVSALRLDCRQQINISLLLNSSKFTYLIVSSQMEGGVFFSFSKTLMEKSKGEISLRLKIW